LQSVTDQQGVAYRRYNTVGLISEVSEKVATQIAKNWRRQPPHSHLRPLPTGTPASIRIYLIFPETRVNGRHFCRCMYGSIFIQICAVDSKRRIFSATDCVLAVQGRSGSSKVDDFGTNLIWRHRSLCSPSNFAAKLTVRKLESWGYPPVKTA